MKLDGFWFTFWLIIFIIIGSLLSIVPSIYKFITTSESFKECFSFYMGKWWIFVDKKFNK